MVDIFREVDEELRRARLETIWKKYGNVIVAVALLAVAGTAGWQGWRYWSLKQSEAAGATFEEAIEAARANKPAEAEALFAGIAKDGASGYAMLARFRAAAETAKQDADKGLAAYDALSADSSLPQILRDLATLRAGAIRVDRDDFAAVKGRLEPLAAAEQPWRHTARELLAVSAIKAGDFEAAGRYLDQMIVDPQTPPGLRARADTFLGLVRAGPLKPAS